MFLDEGPRLCPVRVVGEQANKVRILVSMLAVRFIPSASSLLATPVADHFDVREGLHSFEEALVAGVEGLMTRHGGEIRDLASRLAGALLDAGCRGNGRGFAARLVVGREEGGELVRLRAGIDHDDRNSSLGDLGDRIAQGLEDGRRYDDRGGLRGSGISSTAISPAASSFGVPSFSTLTPSNLPASSAPLKTHCQYSDVVAFTMTATVSSAWLA